MRASASALVTAYIVHLPCVLQDRAAEYVAGIKQSRDCWKLCVERFGATMYPEVKFWCLQTLQEVSTDNIHASACMMQASAAASVTACPVVPSQQVLPSAHASQAAAVAYTP